MLIYEHLKRAGPGLKTDLSIFAMTDLDRP